MSVIKKEASWLRGFGPTQNTIEGLCSSNGLWTARYFPRGAGASLWGMTCLDPIIWRKKTCMVRWMYILESHLLTTFPCISVVFVLQIRQDLFGRRINTPAQTKYGAGSENVRQTPKTFSAWIIIVFICACVSSSFLRSYFSLFTHVLLIIICSFTKLPTVLRRMHSFEITSECDEIFVFCHLLTAQQCAVSKNVVKLYCPTATEIDEFK